MPEKITTIDKIESLERIACAQSFNPLVRIEALCKLYNMHKVNLQYQDECINIIQRICENELQG